jgi:nitroreductase/NAD-dependent dihydropyrimidine dehydrogenase PreA subunit
MIAVNVESCRGCGICVQTCPTGILQLEQGIPMVVRSLRRMCIQCGHCVAVCPTGALSLPAMPVDECQVIDKELMPVPEQADLLCVSRRSIRVFQKTQVNREIINKLISVAGYAPSGKNWQPLEWTVLTGHERMAPISELTVEWMKERVAAADPVARMMYFKGVITAWERGNDQILRNAPHVLIARAPRGTPAGSIVAACALSYLELAAHSRGIGTCWAGFFQVALNGSESVRSAAGITDDHECFGAMLVGYPATTYQRVPKRKTPVINWVE